MAYFTDLFLVFNENAARKFEKHLNSQTKSLQELFDKNRQVKMNQTAFFLKNVRYNGYSGNPLHQCVESFLRILEPQEYFMIAAAQEPGDYKQKGKLGHVFGIIPKTGLRDESPPTNELACAGNFLAMEAEDYVSRYPHCQAEIFAYRMPGMAEGLRFLNELEQHFPDEDLQTLRTLCENVFNDREIIIELGMPRHQDGFEDLKQALICALANEKPGPDNEELTRMVDKHVQDMFQDDSPKL